MLPSGRLASRSRRFSVCLLLQYLLQSCSLLVVLSLKTYPPCPPFMLLFSPSLSRSRSHFLPLSLSGASVSIAPHTPSVRRVFNF
jgi:hypothetical protein